MASYLQQNRKVRISTPLGENVLLLKAFSGTEEISRPFRFQVEMIAENKQKVAFDAMLGAKLTVHLLLPDESTEHHFNGVCVRFGQAGRDENFTIYRADLVPEFQLLSHKAQSRIFQRMSVPDILKDVMKGVTADWRIQGTFEKRDFCVQYRETDFNFASRLMEEEGIFYFFRHEDGQHTMVVANSSSAFADLPGETDILYEELAGGTRDENRVSAWERSQEARSAKGLLWDHCFELPHKHLEAEAPLLETVQAGKETHKLKIKGSDAWEVYDWPGEYAQRFDGINRSGGEQEGELQKIFQDNSRTVGIRMDEEAALAVTAHGASNVKHFVSGHKLKLKRHFSGDGEYVLASVTHRASFGADYRSGKDALLTYQNVFTCFPSALPFRPKRLTAKPVVQGTQTAVVVGPKGEEIFTDKYGRVKVQFHWDRKGKNDEDSSCWIRVAHVWSGNQWGGIHIPRIGMEVLVAFLEGDPDQPVIVGTVYNAREMPPYELPAKKTQSGVKSRSSLKGGTEDFNELRFEDKKGKEEIYFHAQKDFTRIVEHDDDLEVGNDQTILIKRDRKEQVDRNEEVLIRKNRDHHIEGDDGLWVDGLKGRAIRIKKGKHVLTIDMGDNLIEIKMGNMKTTLDMGNHEIQAKLGNVKTKADLGKIEEEALQSIEMKVGGSSVKIDQMGVTVKGMMVKIEGQVMTEVKGLITKVEGSAMLKLGGGIVMIG